MKKLYVLALLVTSLFSSDQLTKELEAKFMKESVYTQSLYKQSTYNLLKGWNKLTTNSEGVDVEKTFTKDEEVVVYDGVTKVWASSKPNKHQLYVKYIEPHMTFFVYAKKAKKLKIASTQVNATCQKLIDTKGFQTVLDSALTKEPTFSDDKTISLNSRYFSHYDRGIYNDTRIMMIYKKLPTKEKKATFRYGPAEPKSMIRFAKEYEGKTFYMYDFYEKACYKGLLPSMKIPPFAVLRKLKDL